MRHLVNSTDRLLSERAKEIRRDSVSGSVAAVFTCAGVWVSSATIFFSDNATREAIGIAALSVPAALGVYAVNRIYKRAKVNSGSVALRMAELLRGKDPNAFEELLRCATEQLKDEAKG